MTILLLFLHKSKICEVHNPLFSHCQCPHLNYASLQLTQIHHGPLAASPCWNSQVWSVVCNSSPGVALPATVECIAALTNVNQKAELPPFSVTKLCKDPDLYSQRILRLKGAQCEVILEKINE